MLKAMQDLVRAGYVRSTDGGKTYVLTDCGSLLPVGTPATVGGGDRSRLGIKTPDDVLDALFQTIRRGGAVVTH
jgi:hypothetical protein